jgi:hypothetical protein
MHLKFGKVEIDISIETIYIVAIFSALIALFIFG